MIQETAPDANPFRPPSAQVELAPEAAGDHPLAGKGRRFFTFVIDYVGCYLAAILVGIALAIAGAAEATQAMNKAEEFLLGIVIVAAYYLFFEGLWGRTPGKFVTGTRVTDLQGRPAKFGDILKRTLARMVPFEALTFFGKTGFHDKASRTQVVRVR